MFVRAPIVNPELLCPRLFGGRFVAEEPSRWEASETDCVKRRALARNARERMSQQDVGINASPARTALGVEDAGGQTQQGVNVGLFE